MQKRQMKLSYLKDIDEIIHRVNEKMEKPNALCEKNFNEKNLNEQNETKFSKVDAEVEQKDEKVIIHVHATQREKKCNGFSEGEKTIIDLLKQFVERIKPKRKKKHYSSEDSSISESSSYISKKSKKKKKKKHKSPSSISTTKVVEPEKVETPKSLPEVSIEELKLKEERYKAIERSLQRAMIELNEYHKAYGLLDDLDKNVSFIQSEITPDWLNSPKLLCPLFRTYDHKLQRCKEEIKQLEYHLNSFVEQNFKLTSLIGSLSKPQNEFDEKPLDEQVLNKKLKEVEDIVEKLEKDKYTKCPNKVDVLKKENRKIKEALFNRLKSKDLLLEHLNEIPKEQVNCKSTIEED